MDPDNDTTDPERHRLQRFTLGAYRARVVALFGETSPAVEYLDLKIKEAPHGADERVLQAEDQVMRMLTHLHRLGD